MNNNTINFSDYDTVLDIYTVIAEKYILFTDKDLIDLSMKDNKQYSAFGITIPNKIIKESINYLNADKSIFSNIVRKYPYIQLILLYWMYNKMYEVDKKKGGIIDGEIYNSIYDFQYETIKYTYFVYPFEIYDNIAKRLDYGKYYDLELVSKYIQQFERKTIKVRDFSNKYNIISYSAIDYINRTIQTTPSSKAKKQKKQQTLKQNIRNGDTKHSRALQLEKAVNKKISDAITQINSSKQYAKHFAGI